MRRISVKCLMIYLPNLIWCNVYIHQGLSDNTVGIFYAVGADGTKTDIQKFFTIADENVYVGISKSEYDRRLSHDYSSYE